MQNKIGRFDIIRILGEGSQGVVHLARDPLLERKVAIKTLNTRNSANTSKLRDALMDEARIISKMSHPNIVSIFEAGEDAGQPFLVFEYVRGMTLDEAINRKKYQGLEAIFSIFLPICAAIAHSHKHRIIHGDLKPANIMLDEEDIPRVMDFGIAKLLSEKQDDEHLYGTPRYMPPEYLQAREISTSNDVYALGLILYEMLTGKHAISGNTISQIIHNVLNGSLSLPASVSQNLNEIFEDIILKASARKKSQRFQSVPELLDALEHYRTHYHQKQTRSQKAQDAAITFLMRKIQRKQDFPALSESLVKINSLIDNEETHSQELANVIAEDFALTNKILKLVNSAYYRGAKPEVTTISQAVLLLGFEEIRSVAVSLMLIDHLHNKSKARKLKDHIISSIYSGILNKDLATEIGLKNIEESFLSGTFFQLGELLTLYYFHEESLEIEDLIKNHGLDKEQASRQILGVSYQILGDAIAREWQLPEYIIHNMKPWHPPPAKRRITLNDSEKLNAITTLSNHLSDALEDKQNKNWRKDAVKIWHRYADHLGLNNNALIRLATRARNNLIDVNHIFKVDLSQSEVMNKVHQLGIEDTEQDKTDNTLDETIGTQALEATQVLVKSQIPRRKRSMEEIFADTCKAILSELQSQNNLAKILNLFLYGAHEALQLDRMIIALYNQSNHTMCARLGLGISDAFLKQFRFRMDKASKDVFVLATQKGVDIYINDTTEFEKKTALPPWYRQIIDAQTFMLFPVHINKKPFGLIYLDKAKKNELLVAQQQLAKLQKMREWIITSIKRKS